MSLHDSFQKKFTQTYFALGNGMFGDFLRYGAHDSGASGGRILCYLHGATR